MGLIARALAPRNQSSSGSSFIPTTQAGGGYSQGSYLNYARAGYSGSEIVFSAIELLATSAAEPHIIGRRWRRDSPRVKMIANGLNPDGIRPSNLASLPAPSRETMRGIIRAEVQLMQSKGLSRTAQNALLVKNGFVTPIPDHPLVKLLNAPNQYTSRGQLWSTVVMDMKLGGNAFVLKVRYTSGPLEGAVAELWRLRPDRVRIIPDADQFCRYEYRTGTGIVTFDYADMMHFKTRNPFNEFYGMSPIAVIMDRLGIDFNMRGFLRTFFEQGGTGPGAILTAKQKLKPDQIEEIKDKLRRFGGSGRWHETLVLDMNESTYQQMGLNRGLRDALPAEIDRQTEARLTMPFGIPGSIIGLLIGYESSSYANKRADWQVLWDVTMTPLLSDLDDVMNLSIVPDFGNIDEVMFDLSDIKALQEDVDALQERHRKNFVAGGLTRERFLDLIGEDPEQSGIVFVPRGVIPTEAGVIGELEAAQAEAAIEQAQNPAQIPASSALQLSAPKALVEGEIPCPTCNSRLPVSRVEGSATVYCRHCKGEVNVGDAVIDSPKVTVKEIEYDDRGRMLRVKESVA